MQYRQLGRTDIEVSVICQGCWSLIGDDFNWGGNALEDSLAAIHASRDAGVIFFDTAEGYGEGESERILGKALIGDRRDEVVIASKVSRSNLRRDALVKACEDSLRNLGTDYIDLYQIHWPDHDVPIAESLEAMEKLRSQGKIRAVGVSNFGVGYLKELFEVGRAETNQLNYSLLWRPIEQEVLPACREHGMSVLCYSPIAQGLLTGKFASADDVPVRRARSRLFAGTRPHARHGEPGCEREVFAAIAKIREISEEIGIPMGRVSLAWLLTRPGVASVIVGGRNAAQARENAAAAVVDLSADVVGALETATEPIKEYLGFNCDMWEHVSRMER